jgi:ribonuclease Z
LMYHEATFLSSEAKRSKETFHSTAAQAAQIASKAEVGALLIGHYSARYADIEGHLKEARAIFDNTHVAVEGGELEILPHPSPYSE